MPNGGKTKGENCTERYRGRGAGVLGGTELKRPQKTGFKPIMCNAPGARGGSFIIHLVSAGPLTPRAFSIAFPTPSPSPAGASRAVQSLCKGSGAAKSLLHPRCHLTALARALLEHQVRPHAGYKRFLNTFASSRSYSYHFCLLRLHSYTASA